MMDSGVPKSINNQKDTFVEKSIVQVRCYGVELQLKV